MRVSEDVPQTAEQRAAQEKARVVQHPASVATPKWAPELFDWGEVQRVGPPPPRDWVVDEWVGFYNTLLAGAGGSGKSYFLQQLCSAVALGRDFIARVRQPLVTLAWLTEDDEREVADRQWRICDRLGVQPEALEGRFILPKMEGSECCLMDVLDGQFVRTSMAQTLREQIGDYKARLIGLDNISVLFGGEEIKRNHVARFYQTLRWCAQPTQAAVILVGHTAKVKGSEWSGSAAWEQLARARLWFTEQPPDTTMPDDNDEPPPVSDPRRYLSKRKVNYTSRDICILQFDPKGGFEVLGVPQASGFVQSINRNKARQVVLTAYTKLCAMNFQPSDAGSSPHYLPKLICDHKMNEGFHKHELREATRDLLTDGVLCRSVIGQYANRTPKYGLTLGTPEASVTP